MQIHPISSDKTPPHVQVSRTHILQGSSGLTIHRLGAYYWTYCSENMNRVVPQTLSFPIWSVEEKIKQVLGLMRYYTSTVCVAIFSKI